MTGSEGLRTTLEDGALLVELDRPEKRNALDDAAGRVAASIRGRNARQGRCEGNLTAAGEAFSTGGDLSASSAVGSRPSFAPTATVDPSNLDHRTAREAGHRGIGGLATGAGTTRPLVRPAHRLRAPASCSGGYDRLYPEPWRMRAWSSWWVSRGRRT